MSNGILELITMLEEEINQSPKPRISVGNKRIVDCDRILDILGDLKVSIPEEVRQASAVLAEKENLLTDARVTSASMLSDARVQSERMLSKEGIIEEARHRAEQIVDRAEENAETIAQGARNYTDEILIDIQRYLREYIEIVENNRMELNQVYQTPSVEEPEDLEEEILSKRRLDELEPEESESLEESDLEEETPFAHGQAVEIEVDEGFLQVGEDLYDDVEINEESYIDNSDEDYDDVFDDDEQSSKKKAKSKKNDFESKRFRW